MNGRNKSSQNCEVRRGLSGSFSLRDYQLRISNFIATSLEKGKSVAVEAPTGTGKTIIGLYSAISFAKEKGLKIVYLTRTNSQQDQVINELRAMKGEFNIKALAFQGRHNLCPLYSEVEEKDDFSSDALSRFCNSRKKKVMEGNQGACRYFNWKVRAKETESHIFSNLPKVEEFSSYAVEHEFCPYESLKHAGSEADLVVMPYAYFLKREIADRFLSRWGVSRENLMLILDEAHNLPDISRDTSSYSLSINQINMAEKEAKNAGDPFLVEKMRSTDFCEALRNGILDMIIDLLKEREEARIRYDDLTGYIAAGSRISRDNFQKMVSAMYDLGETICDIREKEGRVPRSMVLNLAARLMIWADNSEDRFVQILSREQEGNVESFCLEPQEILEPLRESYSIHMSGTLEPFEVYRNVTGFRDMPLMKQESIFPERNRLFLYDDSITTKFDEMDESAINRISKRISEIVSSVRRKSVVFFTSYRLMETVMDREMDIDPLIEQRGMKQEELMRLISRFRRSSKPLFAVMGGRISEGINFPGNQLQLVIVVGIPYPRPDAKQKALQAYYEHRFHNGWEYSVTFPVVVKLRQAMGRLIRSTDDTGVAVILDKRATYFQKYIPEMRLSRDPGEDALNFFNEIEGNPK